jgi:hypothetical protein
MNRILAIVIAVLFGLLVWLHPELMPLVSMVFWYVILYQILAGHKRKREGLRNLCLRQKHQAENAELPDPMELLALLLQVTEQKEPTGEGLAVLVNFGCRLSVSNIYGQIVIGLEDSDQLPTYGVYTTEFHPQGEIFELPGLRGRPKDHIGHYRFWRILEAVCFGSVGEEEFKLPEYIIPFDPKTLSPQGLAVLKGHTRHFAIYQIVWGNRRGEPMELVF